jgi:hypothetical protein
MALLDRLTTINIVGYTLNQTININGTLEPCHFITFDSDLINKVIPGDRNGAPAARMFFLDPSTTSVGRYSLAQVPPVNVITGQGKAPEIIEINASGSVVNGLPAWSIAVARWTNSFTPTIGYEVQFHGNTNSIPRQAQLITGCTNAMINSAIVDYNSYTSAALVDLWKGLKTAIGGVPILAGNALKFLQIDGTATGYNYFTGSELRQSLLDLSGNALKLLRINAGETDLEYVTAKSLDVKLPTNHHDMRVQWTSNNTITIEEGSRCRSSDDTEDIVFTTDVVVDLSANGLNGLDLGSEAANTIYYLYAAKNTTTGVVGAVLSVTNESVSGSITSPAGFNKKRQIKVFVVNDASSNILPFRYDNDKKYIKYMTTFRDWSAITGTEETLLLSNGGSTTFAFVNGAGRIPTGAKKADFWVSANESATVLRDIFWRNPNQTTETYNLQVNSGNAKRPVVINECGVDSSQRIEYRVSNVSAEVTIFVYGVHTGFIQ